MTCYPQKASEEIDLVQEEYLSSLLKSVFTRKKKLWELSKHETSCASHLSYMDRILQISESISLLTTKDSSKPN